jgi:hypothetical protein
LGYINLPPSLQSLFAKINERLAKLETARRFTMPSTTSDFSSATGRNGDIWLNTTSNTPKYLDNTGTVATFGGGSSTITGNVKRPLAGYFYSTYNYDTLNSSNVGSIVNNLYAIPFMLTETKTATSLSVNVVGTTASGVARLGIYSNGATEDYPNALLLDAGTISHATTGVKTVTISQALTGGTLYWLVVVSTTGTLQTLGAAYYNQIPFMPTDTTNGYISKSWKQTGVTTLPATFTATKTLNIDAPLIFVGF